MTPGSIPLVILALVLLALDGTPVDRVEILTSGDHRIEQASGAVVVVEADTLIPHTSQQQLPVYVVAGSLTVEGSAVHITQLGGSIRVMPGATVGELRAFGGELEASDETIASLSTLEGVGEVAGPSWPATGVTWLLFGAAAVFVSRRHPVNVDNLAHAQRHHPVVAASVGVMTLLGGASLLVFMAFTIVLIPVALAGALIGMVLVLLGLVGWSGVASDLLRRPPRWLVSAATLPALSVVGAVPVIGEVLVGSFLLIGLGSSVITFMGYRRFQPLTIAGDRPS